MLVHSRALSLPEYLTDIRRVGHNGNPLLCCCWRASGIPRLHPQLTEFELGRHDALQVQHLPYHNRAP